MTVCPSCTNRWIADLFDALGSPEKAEEIRAAGCGWTWNVWSEDKDGNPYPETVCGRQRMMKAMNDLGEKVVLASKDIETDRNEQHEALKEVDRAASELGASEVIAKLAQLGTRAYLGDKIIRAGEQRALETDGGSE